MDHGVPPYLHNDDLMTGASHHLTTCAMHFSANGCELARRLARVSEGWRCPVYRPTGGAGESIVPEPDFAPACHLSRAPTGWLRILPDQVVDAVPVACDVVVVQRWVQATRATREDDLVHKRAHGIPASLWINSPNMRWGCDCVTPLVAWPGLKDGEHAADHGHRGMVAARRIPPDGSARWGRGLNGTLQCRTDGRTRHHSEAGPVPVKRVSSSLSH